MPQHVISRADAPCGVPSQAVGRIASAFLDDPSDRMTMIGVTGSAGKTTTCWLVRGIFEELQQMTGMIGAPQDSQGLGNDR